jgi:hypothetical protein
MQLGRRLLLKQQRDRNPQTERDTRQGGDCRIRVTRFDSLQMLRVDLGCSGKLLLRQPAFLS